MTLLPSITIRVTKVLATYKSGKMRFRGVPVCPTTHTKTSNRDFYYITATPEQAVFEPETGQVWKVNGEAYVEEKKSHKKYGVDRYHDIRKAKQCVCVLPKTKEAFVVFIKKIKAFKGVGDGKAEVLWDTFKLDTLKHMEHRRTKTLETVVSEKTAKSLVNGYSTYRNLDYAYWMMTKGIPINIQRMIFAFKPIVNTQRTHQSGYKYSIDPRITIEENPYRLASCFSMKFSEVDQLVRNGFEPNISSADPRRMVAAVSEAIRECTKGGHTVAPYKKLLKQLIEILQKAESIASLNKSYIKPAFSIEDLAIAALKAHDKDAYVIYPDGQYQLTPTYLMENVIALRFLSMNSQKVIWENEDESDALKKAFELSPFPLLDQQKDAVVMTLENRFSAIVGGAGTGKTTVLHAVLTAYEALGYVSNLNLCPDKTTINRNIKTMALSCRAAKRMRDSINKSNDGVVRERQISATSIYRFLHETVIEDGEGKYLVVIDEASMLDVPTMYHIIINIHPNVRILLVGDHHQLPPIGPGNVLADVVNSGVIPFTELEIVKRQSGVTGIPEYSKLIRKGLIPPELTTGSIYFHEVETDYIADKCAELYALSPSESIVVASTNALVKTVNELCQKAVNPNGQAFIVTEVDYLPEFYKKTLAKLRKDDPILFTENVSVDVTNGSLGKLVSVERDKDTFGLIKMDDDDIDVIPDFEMISALELGYTMTVHKAQGSQFPRIIVALQGGYIDRSWLYTAITRAEIELHIVSTKKKLVEAIEKPPSASKRRTKLKDLLQEGVNKN
ncbi:MULTISPECIES: AAA family ATPase [unclassified Colwellia]|uniref:AAA family ATPase n=1 Tax=unclassified Colwellia TaxID=196834 RepID=UPI0015F37B39|nr:MULTISPECIES: AAA family ATPase [unclassified Colwellia]MBA6232408.1 AAA family ATPase [Colwellia sp. MB02u-7]MBA6238265.1 AAA family ATPase [Colwellia sp. MB02u-11]MBA6301015.1 AAA family ATPase [Colwellia sp. MB3u-22]MBA6310053.1 AAA family ATPase [Colwellia sp. MB3u-64]